VIGSASIPAVTPQPGAGFTDVGRLVVRCPDRPGIVAVLSRLLADVGANIIESQQHSSDPVGGVFTLAGVRARRPFRPPAAP
jgi:formyltetrahydrofolate hydrolase